MPNHGAKDKYPNHKPNIELIFDMNGEMNDHDVDATSDDIVEQLFSHIELRIALHCLRKLSCEYVVLL